MLLILHSGLNYHYYFIRKLSVEQKYYNICNRKLVGFGITIKWVELKLKKII